MHSWSTNVIKGAAQRWQLLWNRWQCCETLLSELLNILYTILLYPYIICIYVYLFIYDVHMSVWKNVFWILLSLCIPRSISGSLKVFYGFGGRWYLLCLAAHPDVFERGCKQIFHLQSESYYKALLNAPMDRTFHLWVEHYDYDCCFLSYGVSAVI